MNRVINGGSEARMYQERAGGFSSTGLAPVSPIHLHSLKAVSKVRTPLCIWREGTKNNKAKHQNDDSYFKEK
jgi:hypothetical protein